MKAKTYSRRVRFSHKKGLTVQFCLYKNTYMYVDLQAFECISNNNLILVQCRKNIFDFKMT